MEWAAASKTPSWDTAAGVGQTMVSFAGPSSSSAAQLQDFSAELSKRTRQAVPAKRSRGAGGGGVEACSVDGCRSDLSRCREYHRRHRVCEAHSKTPVVIVGGHEQRFCQQCSRFHMLAEFDEGKRSCRKRLDGHNRRRRKPQYDAMNPRSFFPTHQVNQFSVYPSPLPITEQNSAVYMHLLDRQPPFSISFSGTLKAPKNFPFLQDGASSLSAPCSTLLRSLSSAESSNSTSDCLIRMLDPECALSLLSSSPHPSTTSIPSLGPVQHASSHARHAMLQSAANATTAFASDGDLLLVSDAVFEEPTQALPFSWQDYHS